MARVTLISGDGIGPEVIFEAKRCLDTLVKIDWEIFEWGKEQIEKTGKLWDEKILSSIEKTKVIFKGPITTPFGEGYLSPTVFLRKKFNLYCNLRPIKYIPGVKTRIKDPQKIDLVIIRENTEDLYSQVEFGLFKKETKDLIKFLRKNNFEIREDSSFSFKVISQFASEKIMNFAFAFALKNKRKKVTVVTKSNILKETDGLFLKIFEKVSQNYKEKILTDHVLIDNLALQLVLNPEKFDVLVLPNLYGDIISDLAAGLVGGLGLAPSANLGDEFSLFEAVHGSASDLAGKNKANPTALILAGALMLKHLGYKKEAQILEKAVKKIIEEGKYVTFDLKSGKIDDREALSTKEMVNAIIEKMKTLTDLS